MHVFPLLRLKYINPYSMYYLTFFNIEKNPKTMNVLGSF